MAYKHVKDYFRKIENMFFECMDDVQEFDKMLKDGKFTYEEFEKAAKQVALIKSNYERLSYIMFLFNKPARKEKSAKYARENKKYTDILKTRKADDESVIEETRNSLDNFKKLYKELSENVKGDANEH